MFKSKLQVVDSLLLMPDDLHQHQTIIPAQYRRRLSHVSKLALTAALMITDKNINQTIETIDYIAFGSQHGELDNTVNVLNSISDQETLSPMKFSLAVHNATAGLYTIIKKLNRPVTSIAAGVDTFLMTVLDAMSFLNQHKNKTALVVIFDQRLAECYQNLNIAYDCAYAMTLLLKYSERDEANLGVDIASCEIAQNDMNANKVDVVPAIEFFKWYRSGLVSQVLEQYSLTQKFIWQLCV
ncbi:MAG: hypothetical protein EP298_05565 [Gammaproteobacteria bacterium]|nr:MAG: hypothetical protein EP298_05565 [Gammaproteobacteria bacterium]UTW42742.1 beta-ketoacyl synthase chain length factor [bacterium SCSIO 12844]